MLIHKESHIRNHGLTGAQLAFLLDTFADRRAFFIESVRLPDELGTVQCGLVGPRKPTRFKLSRQTSPNKRSSGKGGK